MQRLERNQVTASENNQSPTWGTMFIRGAHTGQLPITIPVIVQILALLLGVPILRAAGPPMRLPWQGMG